MLMRRIQVDALVVYDSAYGNTARVADAIRAGLANNATAHVIADLDPRCLPRTDLLVVGSPTQGGKPTVAMQTWLERIPPTVLGRIGFAAFDTRLETHSYNVALRLLIGMIGFAAPRIARTLIAKGARQLAAPEGFIVTGREGPLAAGEKERATAWAASLAKS
jgi:flavodoxin